MSSTRQRSPALAKQHPPPAVRHFGDARRLNDDIQVMEVPSYQHRRAEITKREVRSGVRIIIRKLGGPRELRSASTMVWSS
jgi:hypothetical protein